MHSISQFTCQSSDRQMIAAPSDILSPKGKGHLISDILGSTDGPDAEKHSISSILSRSASMEHAASHSGQSLEKNSLIGCAHQEISHPLKKGHLISDILGTEGTSRRRKLELQPQFPISEKKSCRHDISTNDKPSAVNAQRTKTRIRFQQRCFARYTEIMKTDPVIADYVSKTCIGTAWEKFILRTPNKQGSYTPRNFGDFVNTVVWKGHTPTELLSAALPAYIKQCTSNTTCTDSDLCQQQTILLLFLEDCVHRVCCMAAPSSHVTQGVPATEQEQNVIECLKQIPLMNAEQYLQHVYRVVRSRSSFTSPWKKIVKGWFDDKIITSMTISLLAFFQLDLTQLRDSIKKRDTHHNRYSLKFQHFILQFSRISGGYIHKLSSSWSIQSSEIQDIFKKMPFRRDALTLGQWGEFAEALNAKDLSVYLIACTTLCRAQWIYKTIDSARLHKCSLFQLVEDNPLNNVLSAQIGDISVVNGTITFRDQSAAPHATGQKVQQRRMQISYPTYSTDPHSIQYIDVQELVDKPPEWYVTFIKAFEAYISNRKGPGPLFVTRNWRSVEPRSLVTELQKTCPWVREKVDVLTILQTAVAFADVAEAPANGATQLADRETTPPLHLTEEVQSALNDVRQDMDAMDQLDKINIEQACDYLYRNALYYSEVQSLVTYWTGSLNFISTRLLQNEPIENMSIKNLLLHTGAWINIIQNYALWNKDEKNEQINLLSKVIANAKYMAMRFFN